MRRLRIRDFVGGGGMAGGQAFGGPAEQAQDGLDGGGHGGFHL